jgi:hypothetical protein
MLYATKYANDVYEPIRAGDDVLTELRFCFPEPYYVDDVMEILICGTIDELGWLRNYNCYAIGDLKFTSLWDRRKFFDSYTLSSQLRFYRWALKRYAEMFPEKIWKKINDTEVGCFIDGAFHKQVGGVGAVEFERTYTNGAPIFYKEDDIEEFAEGLRDLIIGEFVPLVRNYLLRGILPSRDGIIKRACDTVYGPCKYSSVCSLPDAASRQIALETSFVKRDYNPLTHGE